MCACQSVSLSVDEWAWLTGAAYLATAHNTLKPPIKSFALIEVMPCLIRLDKSLIFPQLQQQRKQERVSGRWRGREGKIYREGGGGRESDRQI